MAFERPDWLPETKDAVETERAVGKFWKEDRIFEKSLEQGEGRPTFVFYEGPPTANGRPRLRWAVGLVGIPASQHAHRHR